MNRLQSAFDLKHETPDPAKPAKKDLARRTAFAQEPTHGNAHSVETWCLVVTGCLAGAMITSFSCRLPASHTLSWTTILPLSIKLITLTAVGGAIGTAIPWFFLKAKPSYRLAFLSKSVAAGWVFFPSIALFYRQKSPLMLLALALATLNVSFNLRRFFPGNAEEEKRVLPAGYTNDLPNLYGLPIADFRPLRALLIAMCFQAALVLSITEYPFLAGALLSTSVFSLAWRWSASDSSAKLMLTEKRRSILLWVVALFLTMLALTPWLGGKSDGSARSKPPHKPALITHESNESDVPGSDYAGIILWPPALKKTDIVPPKPHAASFAIGKTSKPVVIPFDGQYWYFKAPSTRPGPRAHIAHGRATYVNVHSTNSAPLLMEAYQNLGTSIDLGCCSEIDVAITNADVRPGAIALGLRLTDSGSAGKTSLDLEPRTIVSSKAGQIPLNRPPVDEVLRFTISRPATIHQFDEITVIYLPGKERSRAGAKISIQSFTLVPK